MNFILSLLFAGQVILSPTRAQLIAEICEKETSSTLQEVDVCVAHWLRKIAERSPFGNMSVKGLNIELPSEKELPMEMACTFDKAKK